MQPLSVQVAAQNANSGPDPSITSWDDLQAFPTLGLPIPLAKIWIEAATGLTKIVRLLPSTADTDRTMGIQRPGDYGYLNHNVWFEAS